MLALDPWHVTRRRFAEGALLTVYKLRVTEFTVAVVSIDLDKANLSMESHKTLGINILDSFLVELSSHWRVPKIHRSLRTSEVAVRSP